MKIIRYVLMIPRWASLVAADIFAWAEASPLGPAASNQDWSTSWLAIVWPKTRFSLGARRCTVAGK